VCDNATRASPAPRGLARPHVAARCLARGLGVPGKRAEGSVMIVGACQMRLHLPQSQSLKDKRQVVKSVLARLRGAFEVSAAEVADQELWQIATLGITCASNDAAHVEAVLDRAVRFVEESRPDCEIADVRIEIQRMLD
jgi:uncharacterized protein